LCASEQTPRDWQIPRGFAPRKLAELERGSEGKEQSRKKTNQLLAQTIRVDAVVAVVLIVPSSVAILVSNLNIYIARAPGSPEIPPRRRN
jgi:hypothetical protein